MSMLLLLAAIAATGPLDARPSAEDIGRFCTTIDSQNVIIDPDYDWALFHWESILAHWASVRKTDSEEQVAAKMRAYLQRNMPYLTCRTPNFVPANGNILKLAVARQNSDFIADMINWRVDLNQIDSIDHATVLDYIRKRIEAAGDGKFGEAMRRYYTRFRAAGALHASELNPSRPL